MKNFNEKLTMPREFYEVWKEQPILHDEDNWQGKYRTYGEMWIGEKYEIIIEN